jgi:uncharacterized protein HemY
VAGQVGDAESAIRRLRSLPDDEGRAATRQAQILIQRDRDFEAAERLLSELVDRRIGNGVAVRRWRAIAAVNAGHFDIARKDIEFIRARSGRQETAQRLEVYYAIANGKYDEAEDIFSKLRDSAHDDFLHARILEARASDANTPLAQREALRTQASELRARRRFSNEFDFDEFG